MRNAVQSTLKTSVLFTTLFAQTLAFADRKWNDANDPRNLDGSYRMNFYQLPPSGDIDGSNKGWSSSYYPKTRGYIAERWQNPSESGVLKFKKYRLPSPYEIQSMSAAQIDMLSPAEKFDIARGKFDLPIATALMKDDPNPTKDWWRGLCNGWTQASVNLPEPHSAEYVNPKTKIKVSFNSGDIKGLMAYYYSYDRSPSKYIGKSCRPGKRILFDIDGSCKDVHPAAFHVAIANEIGLKKSPLAVDRDPTVQVWNHPFVKYNSVVDRVEDRNVSKKATEGTRKEVYVTTTVTFANEQYKIDQSEIAPGKTRDLYEDDEHSVVYANPVLGTEHQEYGTKTYKYVLELDSRDNIIGGDWLYDSDSIPDLIWKQSFKMPGTGYDKDGNASDWSILKDLIDQATSYAKGSF